MTSKIELDFDPYYEYEEVIQREMGYKVSQEVKVQIDLRTHGYLTRLSTLNPLKSLQVLILLLHNHFTRGPTYG